MPVWLAVATVGLGASLFHEFLYPSMHTDWLTTADLLRVGARGVLVVAAVSELARIWKHRISDARTRERQRMAAELHDGLAQELAFLSAQSALVCDQAENNEALRGPARGRRAGAGRGAPRDRRVYSRRHPSPSIRCCSASPATSSAGIGARSAWTLPRSSSTHRSRDELERTAREALTNAARHSEGASISLHLEVDKRALSLRVSDDGIGMPVGGHDADSELHYGMTAMTTVRGAAPRHTARAVGARHWNDDRGRGASAVSEGRPTVVVADDHRPMREMIVAVLRDRRVRRRRRGGRRRGRHRARTASSTRPLPARHQHAGRRDLCRAAASRSRFPRRRS